MSTRDSGNCSSMNASSMSECFPSSFSRRFSDPVLFSWSAKMTPDREIIRTRDFEMLCKGSRQGDDGGWLQNWFDSSVPKNIRISTTKSNQGMLLQNDTTARTACANNVIRTLLFVLNSISATIFRHDHVYWISELSKIPMLSARSGHRHHENPDGIHLHPKNCISITPLKLLRYPSEPHLITPSKLKTLPKSSTTLLGCQGYCFFEGSRTGMWKASA